MNTPYIALTLVALWIGEQRRDILPGQPLPVETAPADIEQLLRLGAIEIKGGNPLQPAGATTAQQPAGGASSAGTNTSEAETEDVSGNGAASDTAAPDLLPAAAEANTSATDGDMETAPAGGKANPRKRTKS